MPVTSLVLPIAVHARQLPTELPQTKFTSGQDVVPYFEGWIHNPDGTFDLVFGYFNRNWQQELAIPAGPEKFGRIILGLIILILVTGIGGNMLLWSYKLVRWLRRRK